MRQPKAAPSLVPEFDVTVHIVLDSFGRLGNVYRETDEDAADRQTIIDAICGGEFNDPVRVIAFNTAEGWARD